MSFLFQASWTFHPALDLSPGTGTAQKDERKGSSRKGVEEGKGLEREAGGAAIELEEKFPSVSVKVPEKETVCNPCSCSPSIWAQPLSPPLSYLSSALQIFHYLLPFFFFFLRTKSE